MCIYVRPNACKCYSSHPIQFSSSASKGAKAFPPDAASPRRLTEGCKTCDLSAMEAGALQDPTGTFCEVNIIAQAFTGFCARVLSWAHDLSRRKREVLATTILERLSLRSSIELPKRGVCSTVPTLESRNSLLEQLGCGV